MKNKKNQASDKSTLRRVFALTKPYTLLLILSGILAVAIVVSTLRIPILTGQAVDLIVGNGSVSFAPLKRILVNICGLIGVTAVCQWTMTALTNRVAYNVAREIRVEAFNRLQKLPVKYIDTQSHGDIVSRIITDADQFTEGLLMGFAQFFTGILTIVLTLVFMFRLSPLITLVVICVTPLSIFIAGFIAKKSHAHFKNQSEKRGAMTAVTEEMLEGISCVKAFGMEDAISERFKDVDKDLRDASFKAVFYSSITNPCTRFVNALVYAGVGIFGALFAISGGITVGGLTAFLSYASQYAKPFNEISGVVTELQNSLVCARRLFDLIDEKEETPDTDGAASLENINGKVELEHVNFSYTKETPLIQDLCVQAKPGRRVAIVGPTGCGKTTMINLLMRFYDVDSGAVRVDGQDIRTVTRDSLRAAYGMVLQDTWLKYGTIRENIAMGKPDASDEEIIAAAKEAYANSFIRRLPKGYDTLIDKGGANISAGQKQLLCVARVMLALPPMLILDEATSSIDTRTEIRVQKAFDKLMEGRTSFVVAHRLSTIRDADTILVMKDGRVIERGRHEELLARNGFYANLYNSQFEKA